MRDGLKIEGMEELRRTLVDVSPSEGRRIARRTVTKVARQVRDAVRQRAPVGATKNLYRSIKSRRSRGKPDEANAEVFADKSGGRTGKGYHWHFLEFGTRKMAAQPFTNPTIEEFRPKIPAIYREEWWGQYRKEMVKRAKKQESKIRR